ncbi:hypothetical protein PR202_gb08378 [Eleusine coracana subsp. coracana]|uniref:Protein kinase domain-containing protein n=1 Tax=Eleusine coracana subsp. coracana TaxID=191504 RepID=A0AAV5EC21_ELECO|nr:hypothetical protein PR202_gb08378 [Eleusine coracana subsp. coracana]
MARAGFSPLVLLLAAAVASLSYAAAVAMLNFSDTDAITDFTKLLSNPPSSWVGGGDVCGGTFVGITCDGSRRVIDIDLSDQGLSGTLTPLLSSLTSLPYDFLRGLTSLTELTMGNLPLVPWSIPEAIVNCVVLEKLYAVNASVTGTIPAVLSNLKSLKMLSLSLNYLTGGLPTELVKLSALELLELDDQIYEVKLSGPIEVLASFKSLKSLNVRNNFLTGIVPASLVGPCNPIVSVLLELSSGFGSPMRLAQTWAGDNACSGKWLGIICRNAVVVEIDLSGQNLSGTISPALGDLGMLERINLSYNNISGVIPTSLTTLSNLIFLDVSSNNITEPVPRFNATVRVIGMRNVSTSPSLGKSKSKKEKMIIVIGLAASILIVLVICVGVFMCQQRKRKGAIPLAQQKESGAAITTELNSIDHLESNVVRFTMDVLLQATNNFSEDNRLGEGGWGVVFKGTIDGNLVAIKRCNCGTNVTNGLEEFNAEINILEKLRHRYVVKLLGYCAHNMEKLLVYEYMPGGTLRDRLLHSSYTFTWTQRMIVARDIARGIEYVHNFLLENFIHRDIKVSNILLDKNLRAKVSDFGLVKAANESDKSIPAFDLAGTFGYVAPEYANTGKVTRKSDVYAYGVVLMEIISGRKVLDESLKEDEKYFLPIFRKSLRQRTELLEAFTAFYT